MTYIRSLTFIFCLYLSQQASAYTLVTSIKPLHSIASYITQGVNEPTLLIRTQASAHHYQLRPQDRLIISKADRIYWVSEGIETAFGDLLHKHPTAIELLENPQLIRYEQRDSEDGHDHHHHHGHKHSTYDPHIWLSPQNALIIAQSMAKDLSQIDPKHASNYQDNLDAFQQELKRTEQTIAQQMLSLQDKPFATLHDAFQYFEQHFDLNFIGNISMHPKLPLSGKQRIKVSHTIKEKNIRCIFYDPAHHPKAAQQLAKQKDIKLQALDPLGTQLEAGKDLYFSLMKKLSLEIKSCLGKASL